MYRSKQGATRKDLQHAAALLIAAAGVKLPDPMNVTAQSSNMTVPQPDPQYASGIQFVGEANVEALRELARAYEAGRPALTPTAGQTWHSCPAELALIPLARHTRHICTQRAFLTIAVCVCCIKHPCACHSFDKC